MIRSSIGIVCVLVFITTCVQSTSAQARGDFSPSTISGRSLQSQLGRWIELADKGISDRILSSDGYHDDFRFRAAPVKQSRNWKMSIVDARPAKIVSSKFNGEVGNASPAPKPKLFDGNGVAPVVDWVWQSSSDLAVRHCELDDPFDSVSLAFIPRPLPARAKLVEAKSPKVKLLELKLVKTKPSTRKRAMNSEMPIAVVRPEKKVSSSFNGKAGIESPTHKPQYFSSKNTAPVVDWVWQSSSDLAVRYCELDDPFDPVSLAFIPRPLPAQTKPVAAKLSKVKLLELKLVRTKSAKQKRSMNSEIPIADAHPEKKVSSSFNGEAGIESPTHKPQYSSSKNIAPVVDWVWQSSSDLAVRYCELDDPFDPVSLAFIPRPLPARAKPVEARHSKVKLLELKLVKTKSAEQKRAMNSEMPIADAHPEENVSSSLNGAVGIESLPHKPQYSSSKNIAPVVNWVWQSSSDLAVRYCELDDPFDAASLAIIPRPLPPRTKAVETKPSQVTLLELKLVKVKSAEQKRAMATSRTDYWTYYADCDRWNVVFAIPKALLPTTPAEDQQVVDAQVEDQHKSKINLGLQELAARIADRLESAISLYRTISLRFLISRS